MRRRFVAMLFVAGCFLLFTPSCSEGFEDRDFPGLSKVNVSNVSPEGARFQSDLEHGQLESVVSYGFLWSELSEPFLEGSERIEFYGIPEGRSISASITSTLKLGRMYYVKSFIKTSSHTIYSPQERFESRGSGPPDVYSVEPGSGYWGDTLLISGAKFSSRNYLNEVFFGDQQGTPLETSDSMIKVLVPPGINGEMVNVTVSIFGNTSNSDKSFEYLVPQMPEIYPLEAYFYDTLDIRGSFSGRDEYLGVDIGGKKATKVFVSPELIRVRVPAGLKQRENQISLDLGGTQLEFAQPFTLKAPEIHAIGPETVYRPYDTIEIKGRGFNPFRYMNTLEVNGVELDIIQAYPNSLIVSFPKHMWPTFYLEGSLELQVKVSAGGQFGLSNEAVSIHWKNPWTTGSPFPGTARRNAQAFVANEKIYYGTGISLDGSVRFNDFWEYDPELDGWTEVESLPGPERDGAISFVEGEKAFLGLGEGDRGYLKDFFKFNPDEKKWMKTVYFGGGARVNPFSFRYKDQVYVGAGHNNFILQDLWVLDAETEAWTRATDFITTSTRGIGINLGNEAYVKNGSSLYHFISGAWIKEGGSFFDADGIIGFGFRENIFLGCGRSFSSGTALQELFEYDLEIGTELSWPLPEDQYSFAGSVVVLNDRAYILGGNPDSRDVLIFDPE